MYKRDLIDMRVQSTSSYKWFR